MLHFGAFFRVLLPLAIPGVIATTIFCFITAWNELMFAYILTQTKVMTVPVALVAYVSEKTILWGEMSASALIAIMPALVLALSAQKYLLRAMTLGAIKG